MKALFIRVINISPLKICLFVKNHLQFKKSKPEWHIIRRGYLKGIRIFLNKIGHPAFFKMINGEYDKFIYNIIVNKKFDGKVFWDIGAHIGIHTLGFARMVGEKGGVVAFEPNILNFRRLQENVNANPGLSDRVSLINEALSCKTGSTYFFTTDDIDSNRSSGGYLSGITPPLAKDLYSGFKKTKVRLNTIDNFLESNKKYMPNVLKIDVEGAEADVLQGGINFLKKHKPLLLIEVHNVSSMLNVAKILIKMGYGINIIEKSEISVSRCFILAKKQK
jgi:FkbM family methyltransferase